MSTNLVFRSKVGRGKGQGKKKKKSYFEWKGTTTFNPFKHEL